MSKEHEENIKKEFAAAEGIAVEATETPNEVIKELGKVDVSRQMDHTSPDDPEIKRLNALVGYTRLNLNTFPSKGNFIGMILKFILELQRLLKLETFLLLMKKTLGM
jgi:hypothetical protein